MEYSAAPQNFSSIVLFSFFSVLYGVEDDFQNMLEKVFTDYRERLQPPRKELYNPYFYLTWGNFDILVVCFIDDFEIIHKLSTVSGQQAQQFFVGFLPSYGSKQIKVFSSTLNKDFPLMSISHLKFNPFLISVLGEEFIKEFFTFYFSTHKSEKPNGNEEFIFRLLSWAEILLLGFSNNYEVILEETIKYRELTISKMLSQKNERLFDKLKGSNLIKSLFDNDSYFSKSHIFSTTYTILGMRFQEYKNFMNTGKMPNFSKGDTNNMYFLNEVVCKPGHLRETLDKFSKLKGFYDCNYIYMLPGKQDILLSRLNKNGDICRTSFREGITKNLELIKESKKAIEKSQKIPTPKIRSNLVFPYVPEKDDNIREHPDIYSFLMKNHEFKKKEIDDVIKKLISLEIPKDLIFGLERIFSIYFNCLDNYRLLDTFIELYPLINRMINFLLSTEPIDDIPDPLIKYKLIKYKLDGVENIITREAFNRWLKGYSESLNQALLSRYTQSYAMNEITDFTAEFRGSFLTFLSALNGFQRGVLSYLKSEEARVGFPLISSELSPRILNEPLGAVVYLNYCSLFEPLDLAMVFHESAHYFLSTELCEVRKKIQEAAKKTSMGNTFLEDIYADHFENIIADIIMFYLIFLGDEDLYSKYFWGVQNRFQLIFYENEKNAFKAFKAYLIRYFLSGCPKLKEVFHKVRVPSSIVPGNAVVHIFNEILDKQLATQKTNPYIRLFFDTKDIDKRNNFRLQILGECIVYFEYIKEIILEIEDQLIEKLKKMYPNYFLGKNFDLSRLYKVKIKNLIKNLLAGKPIIYGCKNLDNSLEILKFTQMVLYAYIKETLTNIEECPSKGRPNISFKPTECTISPEPDYTLRHCNFRITTLLSFWDLSQKLNGKILLDILDELKIKSIERNEK